MLISQRLWQFRFIRFRIWIKVLDLVEQSGIKARTPCFFVADGLYRSSGLNSIFFNTRLERKSKKTLNDPSWISESNCVRSMTKEDRSACFTVKV